MIRLGGLVNQKGFGKFEQGRVISNPFATAFIKEAEGEDHEVSMGQNQLDTIIKMATELKTKMGEDEKQIPAWIQDHISKAESYISQATNNYHEYGDSNEVIVNEASVSKLHKDHTKVVEMIQQHLQKYKSLKGTPQAQKHVSELKKLNAVKKKIEADLDTVISGLYKDAELKQD